jgi:Icc-related predicted phosphoesterase
VSIRLAALGDLHVRTSVPDRLASELGALHRRADALVLTGDMTDSGRLPEIELVAEALTSVRLPKIAVLGNHDRRCLRRTAFRRILERADVRLLDAESATLRLGERGVRVGFAGIGGYGGGFWPDEGPPWPHYRFSQAISVRARREAGRLQAALSALEAESPDLKVVVMHYAPTTTTLGNEPLVKYWMLGNIELARVIDRYDIDLVLHGHAHLGNSHGRTPGGTPVRNVAVPVTGGLTFLELAWRGARPLALSSRRPEEAPPEYPGVTERRA